jgi:hypothetical protein
VTERQGYQKFRSFSQLDLYLTCGECYRLKYVEKAREQPSVWSVGGTAFHSCAEWFLGGDLTDVERVPNAWDTAWQLAYEEACAKLPEGADPDVTTWRAARRGVETAAWWTYHGMRFVRDFMEWWPKTGFRVFEIEKLGGTKPALEYELLVTLGGVPVRAIPDALIVDEHGQLDVLDYKSGKADGVKKKDPYQLAVYAAAAEVGLGIRPTWGLFYATRVVEAYPHDLSRIPLSRIEDDFGRFDERELAGIYKPNPGRHLGLCQQKESR